MIFNFIIHSIATLEITKPMLGELGAITFGGVAGFTSGYVIKKIFKVVLVFVGLVFIILQFLSYHDILIVNWSKLQMLFQGIASDESQLDSLKTILMSNLPTGGGFLAGFAIGAKKG